MAITALFAGTSAEVKGPYHGNAAAIPYHLRRQVLSLSGTYVTGGFQIDLATGIVSKRGIASSMLVNWVKVYGDYDDGSLKLTIQDSSIALASGGAATPISAASTGNLVTLKLFTGSNGTGGAELANATPVAGAIEILYACQLGSLMGAL